VTTVSPATNNVYYVLSDHLGSTSVVANSSGVAVATQGYYPYGETRYSTGTLNTDRLYTDIGASWLRCARWSLDATSGEQ
jgi:hypothetical protein